MSRNVTIWGVIGLLWGAFFLWYTNLQGPLSGVEVEAVMARLESGGGDPADIAALRNFLESDTGDDFVMLNVIEMNEGAGGASTEALDEYMAYMWPALLSRASHPIFTGTAAAPALDVWGIDDAKQWSTGALMRYRSRRDMVEIAGNSEFQGSHEFKIAAMAKTIAFPLDPWLSLGDPRLLLALILGVIGLGLSKVRRTDG
jgi:hypothetical protein